MSESNEILEKIERYTKGQMSVVEKLAFEQDLRSDESLQKHLELSQIVDEMVIGAETWKLKEQMRKDLYTPKSKTSSYLAWSFFLLVASVGWYVMYERPKMDASTPSKVIPNVASIDQKEEKPVLPIDREPVAAKITENKRIVSASSSDPELKMESISIPSSSVPIISSQTAPSAVKAITIGDPNPKEVLKVDNCATFMGEVEFYTIASCKGEETGEVYLKSETVKGGTPPFSFVLGERMGVENFKGVASGEYSLLIKDARGCSVENAKNVVIPEKICKKTLEFTFNPEFDPAWVIPYDRDRRAVQFKILEKSGKLFFQTLVTSYQPAEWSGESNTGLLLGVGVYFFVIEYSDGSMEEGNIVVSR